MEADELDGSSRNGPEGLSELELLLLAFEKQWWRSPGAKQQAIRQTFSLSAVQYFQIINRLIDHPEAIRQEPALVGRLRRARDGRTGSRQRLTPERS